MSPRQIRIAELEAAREQMNTEFKALPAGTPRRRTLLREISAAGQELRRLGKRPGRG